MWLIFIILLVGGGDLVKLLIEKQQYGPAVMLAAVLTAGGLALFWIYTKSGGSVSDGCDTCDDSNNIVIERRLIERVIDSRDWAKGDVGLATVNAEYLDALTEEFNEQVS
jgi:hypothetical protein